MDLSKTIKQIESVMDIWTTRFFDPIGDYVVPAKKERCTVYFFDFFFFTLCSWMYHGLFSIKIHRPR